MVRPDKYVCQSWHVAAKVIIQPYLRKSRRNRIEEEEKEEEEEEEESEQFETVIPPHSEQAPFFTAREDDDYSVTEHSPSIFSDEASETLQEEDITKGVRFQDVSKTLMVDQTTKTKHSRMCKDTLDEGSETLIDKVYGKKTLKHSANLVDESSETLISKASKTLVNNKISSSTSLSHTLLPFPASEQFHSVAEDEEDLKSDRTISITLADPRNNQTQMVSLKKDSVTLIDPSSTTIIADTNPQLTNSDKKQEFLECAKIRSEGEGVQFGEALRQVDKFLEETEQYLAGQGFNLLEENEKGKDYKSDSPVTGTKQEIQGRRKPQKLVVPKSFVEKKESSATNLFEASQVSSTSPTLLPSEKSAGSKRDTTYKSKWFDKIKNKFEKTEGDIPSKRADSKNGSDDITYDEIDEDSDGPYMPKSEFVEAKEEEKKEEVFYKEPPPPRPLAKKKEERGIDRIGPEHIYEEITPRLVTPVRYRRKRGTKVDDPDAEKDCKGDRRVRDVALKPTKKTTSCMTSLATCMPWWMAKRFYWKKDRKSEAKFAEESKRNSRIRARQS